MKTSVIDKIVGDGVKNIEEVGLLVVLGSERCRVVGHKDSADRFHVEFEVVRRDGRGRSRSRRRGRPNIIGRVV